MGLPGGWEWMVVFAVALIVFGPKRLPEIGRQIGKGMRVFREATREIQGHLNFDDVDYTPPRRPPKRVEIPAIAESSGTGLEGNSEEYPEESSEESSEGNSERELEDPDAPINQSPEEPSD